MPRTVLVRVLGPVEVDVDGEPAPLPPQSARLLALLVAVGGPVTADAIAEHVTGGDPRSSGPRTAVSRLRSVVGDRLRREGEGYVLVLGGDELDVERFRALVSQAADLDGADRVGSLRAALGLWRGRAFGRLGDEHWALGPAAELDRARALATEDLASTLVEAGDPSAIPLLEAHVTDHLLAERPVALLMEALAADGRTAEAGRAFQRLRADLGEAGLEPSAELADLDRRLLRGEVHRRGASRVRSDPPQGRVTLLFTDVVGSTALWDTDPDTMSASLQVHDEVVRAEVDAHDGHLFATGGDGFAIAFRSASTGVRAALAVQRRLEEAAWPGSPLAVRMGLHTGTPEVRDDDYFGPDVNLAARVGAAAGGGQVLLTDATRDEAGADDTTRLGTHRLRGISEPVRLWQLGTRVHPPLRAGVLTPVQLPEPRSELLGRETSVATICARIGSSRLVTITGAGGAGKTRLAIEVARRLIPDHPGGTTFVDLTLVDTTADLLGVFAAALGAPDDAGALDRALRAAAPDDVLLVVDNCEHVLDPAAEVVDDLLLRHGNLRVLATSREALEIDGEHTHRLVSLDASPSGAAVDLFLERAGLAEGTDRTLVAEICEALDGLPLAIELAATRTRSMSLVELRDHLDDRFRLLTGGRRRSRRRQTTLDAVIAWSHDLLEPAERRFLHALSVFVGSFDAESAAAATELEGPAALVLLDALVAKSMVEPVESTQPTRYRLLESIRLFAAERLAAEQRSDDVRARVARFLGDRHRARRRADMLYQEANRNDQPTALALALWALERRELALFARVIHGVAWDQVSAFTSDPEGSAALAELLDPDRHDVEDLERQERQDLITMLGGASPHVEHTVGPARTIAERVLHWADEEVSWSAIHDSEQTRRAGLVRQVLTPMLPRDPPAVLDRFPAGTGLRALAGPSRAAAHGLLGDWAAALHVVRDEAPATDDPALRLFVGSCLAYLQTMSGDPDGALATLADLPDGFPPGHPAAARRHIAEAAAHVARGDAARGRSAILHDLGARQLSGGGHQSTHLAVLAWIRHRTGHHERATELIDATVVRFDLDLLLTCRIKAIISGWADHEFLDRVVEWHDDPGRASIDPRTRLGTMADLVDQEVEPWT
ncbi:MAG: hypothetical protein KF703_07690 [Actinobacteria bacterium]|nr:hypothetical protein [Actinomycetota bacterium]